MSCLLVLALRFAGPSGPPDAEDFRMRRFLFATWDSLKAGYWFVPALLTLLAVALAPLLGIVDRSWVAPEELRWVFQGGAEGARAVLSAIATSTITVAGVVFSVMIVVLTLASQQFGPRILRYFSKDRGIQVVLGVFISTFVYCLLVLRTVKGSNGGYVPHLSVTAAVVLAVASTGFLIYFINHISMIIQANVIIAAIGAEIDAAIDRLAPLGPTDRSEAAGRKLREQMCAVLTEAHQVTSGKTGYVQHIDTSYLVELAEKHALTIEVTCAPGSFVAAEEVIIRVSPPGSVGKRLVRKLRDTVAVGDQRTLVQDLAFGFDQLVELALRALSPSLNDPRTASACIDRVGATLAQLLKRPQANADGCFADSSGRPRLVLPPRRVADLVAGTLHELRAAARGHPTVMRRLMETIAGLRALAPEQAVSSVLDRVTRAAEHELDELATEEDRAWVKEAIRASWSVGEQRKSTFS